ncbi:MAG: hypothetical protein IT436_00545 [Phycisphaerales bacterium]|nr:hypothetical protein [Phycisphaerales bacterium]
MAKLMAGAACVVGVVMVGGCSAGPGVERDRVSLRDADGRLPGVKPGGVVFVKADEDEAHEAGPAPYGYIRIIGEPDPNWRPGGTGGAGGTRAGLMWEFIGPRPISSEYWSGEGNAGGRVVAIAPHPTDANTCYIAAASGGVWKTTDGGTNWTPLTDGLSIMNSGAIAVDPSDPDTVYYGTGEYGDGSTGDGLFRSTDAGATWERIATSAQLGTQVTDIAVHPTDSSILHVTGRNGYWRSTDGGANWSQLLTGICNSVVINTTTPTTVYIGRRAQGVYRSLDGGTTLAKLAGGLPATAAGSVYLTIGRSNPAVLYAAILSGGSLQGLYRTADGGGTWVAKTATPNFPEYGDYACFVSADPANPDIVYCGGVDPRFATAGILKTSNGGNTWTEISDGPVQVHPDHHALEFGPGGLIWECNDGGIYKSTNGGASWTNANGTLAAAQIYNLVQHPTLPNRALGGTQDNGTPEKTSTSLNWPQLQTGDGGFSVYDFSVAGTRRYTTYVYLTIYRYSSGGSAEITGAWGSDPANFIAPLVGDPNASATLLGGTNRVWRTTNATAGTPTWTAISTSTVAGGGTLNAIAVAKGASSTIYSGSTTGRVYVTTDASTWNNRSTGLPTSQVSDIMISPADPGTAYVSYYATSGGRVFRTTNFGVSWTNVTGSLPTGVRANALAIDWGVSPPGLYVGSGAGMYFSLDGGASWTKNNATFPNVNVGDLFIDATARTITAGTYGRGAWRAALLSACRADLDGDGVVDFADYLEFLNRYDVLDPSVDFNGDGVVDFTDYLEFLNFFDAGC